MKQWIFSVLTLFILVSTSCTNEKKYSDEKIPKKSIVELEKDLQESKDPLNKFYIESKIVNEYSSAPISSESVKSAKSHAEALLLQASNYTKDWNYGNALHHANLVLGRVSLIEGNTESAKNYLELASKTPGSPQLNSFGPNMTLAKELLEKKEKAAVLGYLDACAKFWVPNEAMGPVLDQWKLEIAQGKIPDFNGNLKY